MAAGLRFAASARAFRATQALAGRRGPAAAFASRLLAARGYRRLVPKPELAEGTPSSVRLNRLLEAMGGTSYLEVGIQAGLTLEAVRSRRRVGVDPAYVFDPWAAPSGVEIHRMTSDRYFSRRDEREGFDLIFLDGLHEFRQTYRDVVNALSALRPGGAILIDDVVPSSEAAAARTKEEANRSRAPGAPDAGAWMGDVFRVVPMILSAHPEIRLLTISGDGHRPQTLLVPPEPMAPTPAPEHLLSRAERLAYADVFAAGIPAEFGPASLDEAIRAVRKS